MLESGAKGKAGAVRFKSIFFMLRDLLLSLRALCVRPFSFCDRLKLPASNVLGFSMDLSR